MLGIVRRMNQKLLNFSKLSGTSKPREKMSDIWNHIRILRKSLIDPAHDAIDINWLSRMLDFFQLGTHFSSKCDRTIVK
jgi:hypothetical protein